MYFGKVIRYPMTDFDSSGRRSCATEKNLGPGGRYFSSSCRVFGREDYYFTVISLKLCVWANDFSSKPLGCLVTPNCVLESKLIRHPQGVILHFKCLKCICYVLPYKLICVLKNSGWKMTFPFGIWDGPFLGDHPISGGEIKLILNPTCRWQLEKVRSHRSSVVAPEQGSGAFLKAPKHLMKLFWGALKYTFEPDLFFQAMVSWWRT